MSYLKTVLVLVMSLCVSSVAAASTDTGSLLVGVRANGRCGLQFFFLSGYASSLSMGSYSPTGLTGGETVSAVFDGAGCPSAPIELAISGFSSNPGQNWLSSITCGAVTKTGASSVNFTYSSGTAYWIWGTPPFGFASKFNSNVSCTITHK